VELKQLFADRAGVHDGLKQGLLIGIAVLTLTLQPSGPRTARFIDGGASSGAIANALDASPRLAVFGAVQPSEDVRRVADWVATSRDNQSRTFAILDKRDAQLYVFNRDARIVGASRVLLGAAPGDDSVPGIGQRPMDQVRPEEKTTPAGRFVSHPGRNASGEEVIWVDYDAAVSMHRVRIVDPKERRLERLASAVAEDRRISYGCINIPIPFFDAVMRPMLGASPAVVYVLPERKQLAEVFPAIERTSTVARTAIGHGKRTDL